MVLHVRLLRFFFMLAMFQSLQLFLLLDSASLWACEVFSRLLYLRLDGAFLLQ